jgi:hypothetical protein
MKLTTETIDRWERAGRPLQIAMYEIAPSVAQTLLSRNRNNRNIRRNAIIRYAEMMTAGEWLLTGDAVRVCSDGDLIDGQHRLHAVVESGKTVEMIVMLGADPRVKLAIDSGIPRGVLAFAPLPERVKITLTAAYRMSDPTNRAVPGIRDRERISTSPLCKVAIEINEASRGHIRAMASGAARAAICAAMLEWPEHADFMRSQYLAMCRADFVNFSTLTAALYRQLTDPSLANSGGSLEIQRFFRSMYAFDPANNAAKTIRWSDAMPIDRYRAIVRRHLNLEPMQ